MKRIEQTLSRFGDRFLQRVFAEEERLQGQGKADQLGFYAKRFAAKEACSKALGTGIAQGVYWQDMQIIREETGLPILKLSGGALQHAKNKLPDDMKLQAHVTMTDDYPWAQAQVILEAISFS